MSGVPGLVEVAIVGSTGSIGTQALEVVRAARERFDVVALGAQRSVEQLACQAVEFEPKVVAIGDRSLATRLSELVPSGTEVRAGAEGLASLAELGDVTCNAVVGFAGLAVTLASLSAGKRLALANKESLVAGGPLVQRARATDGAELVPIDSEHSAIYQCLEGSAPYPGVRRLVLTASGGPFRGYRPEELAEVTLDEALAHPTWRMGPKNTIDSSTLMNKGLEVIEAHELFGIGYDAIDVVVHPQSVVHSMVEYRDGSTIAQLSVPDMRLAIGYALGHPARLACPFGALDWTVVHRLDFEPPARDVFRCLALAYEAGRTGGTAPTWLNAANEVAVEAFIAGRISWTAIGEVVATTLDAAVSTRLDCLDDVLDADRSARQRTVEVLTRWAGRR